MFHSRFVRAIAVIGTLALSVLIVPRPAVAAATPHSPATWAGARVREWNSNGGFREPRVVQARWQIPCLSTGADGAYDQWIGIEDTNGTSKIQVASVHTTTCGWMK
jgi:hypothetical protein